jgi:hypothetical protein
MATGFFTAEVCPRTGRPQTAVQPGDRSHLKICSHFALFRFQEAGTERALSPCKSGGPVGRLNVTSGLSTERRNGPQVEISSGSVA